VRFSPGCGCCAALKPCSDCVSGLPTPVYATFHNVSGAACLDGLSIRLDFRVSTGNNWSSDNAVPCTWAAGACTGLWVQMNLHCTGTGTPGTTIGFFTGTGPGNCTNCLTLSDSFLATFDCATAVGSSHTLTIPSLGCMGSLAGAQVRVDFSP
jgi:hypothetical protein